MQIDWNLVPHHLPSDAAPPRPPSSSPPKEEVHELAEEATEVRLTEPAIQPHKVELIREGSAERVLDQDQYRTEIVWTNSGAEARLQLKTACPPGTRIRIKGSRRADWRAVRIRAATPDDATTISAWFCNSDEAKWIGAEPSQGLEDQIRSWILSAKATAILTYHQHPVGFTNVANVGSLNSFQELGRLIVRPEFRSLGFGTSLIHTLGQAVVAVLSLYPDEWPRLVARVNPGNRAALGVVRKAPFSQLFGPLPWETDDYDWFSYLLRPRAKREKNGLIKLTPLARVIAELRTKRQVSQAVLAFQCNLARTTINMIEAAEREPSLEVLQRLLETLALEEQDVVRLLGAAVNLPDPDRYQYNRPLESEASAADDTLWIITDQLAEFQTPRIFAQTLEAIRNGKHRWYVLEDPTEGFALVESLKGKGIPEQQVESRVRIFSSHKILCALRIEVRNPAEQDLRRATVEGADGGRAALSGQRAEEVARILMAESRKIELGLVSELLTLHYPPIGQQKERV